MNIVRLCGWGLATAISFSLSTAAVQANDEAEGASDVLSTVASRPNIVFILADDLGYTDIASYGGEVSTPALSALAEQGVRFTNYHTAANCAPARAMLLTGVDSHAAGVSNIPELLAPEQRVHAQYQGELGDNVVTVAEPVRGELVTTPIWQVNGIWGRVGINDPVAGDLTALLLWRIPGRITGSSVLILPAIRSGELVRRRRALHFYAEDFYSSRFLVDKTIEFIDSNREDGKPFFAYLPFQAVHMPVQAPQAYIDKYQGVYDAGWDVAASSAAA